MDHALGRCVLLHIGPIERALHERDDRFGAQREQIDDERLQPLRNEVLALRGGDIPGVAGPVLHPGAPLAVFLILRLANRLGAGLQRARVRRVGVGDVDVERRDDRRNPNRSIRVAAANHQHRVADSHFRVHAAARPRRAKRLLGAEGRPHEFDERRRIGDDHVRRDRAESFADERGRRPSGALLRLERRHPAVHLLDRQILLALGNVPPVSERIGDMSDAIAVELIGRRRHEPRTGGDGALHPSIRIVDLEVHRHRRSAERFRTRESVLRRLLGQHEDRVADLELRVRDAPVPLEAHQLARAERARVEVDGRRRVLDAKARRRRLPSCHCPLTLDHSRHWCGPFH